MSQGTTEVLAQTAIDQEVAVDTGSGRVVVALSFHNRSNRAVYLPRRLTHATRLGNEEFEITLDGARVPYVGELIKRAAPTEKDFVAVGPDESLSNRIDITDDYAFAPGAHQYRIRLYGNYIDPKTKKRVTANTAESEFPFETK